MSVSPNTHSFGSATHTHVVKRLLGTCQCCKCCWLLSLCFRYTYLQWSERGRCLYSSGTNLIHYQSCTRLNLQNMNGVANRQQVRFTSKYVTQVRSVHLLLSRHSPQQFDWFLLLALVCLWIIRAGPGFAASASRCATVQQTMCNH